MTSTPDSNQPITVDFSISSVERRWLLVLFDLLALNGAFLLSVQLRSDLEFRWDLLVERPTWFLLLNVLWFFFGYLFQVYDLEKAGQAQTAFVSVLQAGFLTAGIYPFIPYLPPALPPSRQPLFIAVLLPIAFLLVGRGLYLLVFAQPIFRRRALIYGAGWAGQTIFRAINEHGESLYELVGFVDDDPSKHGEAIAIHHEDSGAPLEHPIQLAVLGGRQDIRALIRKHRVHTVVLAVTHNVGGDLLQVLTDSLQQGIEILPMPLLYEQLTGKVPVEHIGDHWSVSMPIEHPGTRAFWHLAKRFFDILWASLGLILLAVLFPFLALAIYLDSPGPILYTQERVGRYGRSFRVIKFRSMVPDAEKDGAVWAREKDDRVTRVGRFLRKMHIDEFPQFVNILKGDMSVVGPRPERSEFIEELAEEIPFYRVRHAVKPGMAGWGLIHQGYGASKEDALVKLQYDLYYIKHQSFWLDLMILGRTFLDAFSFGGR
jgi:exopolysaccharide biosynthesis polyprenyl glycosylphosphotransferase